MKHPKLLKIAQNHPKIAQKSPPGGYAISNYSNYFIWVLLKHICRKSVRPFALLWTTPIFAQNLLYKWNHIALFYSCAIFWDFKKSFLCCILDRFTLFFMSDQWPSPPQGSKLDFFDILLSWLTKYRWITTFPNSKFKGVRVI